MLLDETLTEDEEIQFYIERKRNGEDYSAIRKELIAKGYSKEKVSIMMREIEDSVIATYQKKKFGPPPIMIAGFVLGTIGLVLLFIGIRGILTYILIFSGSAMIAVRRTNKGGNIERSKWNRR